MALAHRMMTGGFSAGQAKAINGDVASGVSAAGTTISDATGLIAGISVVTTAAASSGVRVGDSEIGDEYEILNLGANPVMVYPPSGSQVNALTASLGFLLGMNSAVKVRKFTATRWVGYLSA